MEHRQQITALCNDVQEVADKIRDDEFWEMIRELVLPVGWTSEAEFRFAVTQLDFMKAALQSVHASMAPFMESVRAVKPNSQ